ncbi:hypothetical protein ACH47B_06545 [Rhodococcus sp. NPDC019627]|uniref:hypothetical protein n=1 Tax=unclassified Rhodococcus (in: high G+C Gram-positive bacteria) TaxID=192944 RepID=UPI0037A9F0B1
MSDTSLDVEVVLVQYAAGVLPGFKVYGGELPPGFEGKGLPAVRFIALPARETARAWNGPGLLNRADVDVDVYDTDPESVADSAALVRSRLDTFSHPSVGVLGAPAFSRRPDWNDNVRRRGAVLSLVTR